MDVELFLNIFIICIIFIIGTLFGSFFTLATYRIPRKEDIVKTRSYCPKCKHRLGFFDLIPILSYIFHFGKCRYCKEKISPRYILIEFFNGVAFVLMYFLLGYTVKFLALVILYVTLFLIIGSNIMLNRMTPEEVKEVEKKQKNKDKNSKKKGVFLVELLAAVILFTVLMIIAYSTIRNYSSKSSDSLSRSNAIYLGTKAMEVAKATDYKDLISYTNNFEIDDITYTVDVTVEKESDVDFDKEDLVSVIYVNVSYLSGGEDKSFDLKTVKINDRNI